jgi:hypothetical protein
MTALYWEDSSSLVHPSSPLHVLLHLLHAGGLIDGGIAGWD